MGDYAGKIVVADRGTCDFVVKAKNVQSAGGVGIIVANNDGSAPFTMGGADASVTIPGVMVSQTDGAAIKAAAGTSTTIKLADPPPLKRDGDLDSDIVWHEYGHGLTWRMIGKMSGPLAGAIGEGMGDVLAVIANEDDRVGEYSASDPFGIRSLPYDNYNRTYGDIVGDGVHFDGEVYGAIGWRLLRALPGRRHRQERAARRPGRRHELHAAGADLRGHARRHPRRSRRLRATTSAPAWSGTRSPSTASASAPTVSPRARRRSPSSRSTVPAECQD